MTKSFSLIASCKGRNGKIHEEMTQGLQLTFLPAIPFESDVNIMSPWPHGIVFHKFLKLEKHEYGDVINGLGDRQT